ncbi:MAG: ABC transporter permease [Deltaproteobacteria bacterium]|jgi:ABC-type dipeptide/oligopeptide/nickel transport system permease subunit|nr:ABC transporter permease [Deltaproteobacteria bacterium]MBW1874274.1 ABC transporter permease [Deltaproteobacteria bacterium]MBW2210437.1 ABC transporter permease [Deltaproteobacteria bacterium]MBW2213407.1 ABC transporter permease [Deltaproteobacteria bacterium]MBW2550186.1 ABC transporter permease [Deltaproteobacteria bacterium]
MDSRAFRRFRRNKGALGGLVLVVAVTVLGLAGPWLAPYDPVEQFTDALLLHNGLPAGPGIEPGHWLGGDVLARDELSRLLSGARVSMLVAYLATALAVLIGVTLGLVSGYVGGRLDTFLMRVVDVVLSMPFLLIAIVMQRVWDAPGIWTICVVLGVLSWTTLARITRAKTMEARELDYIQAARALGLRHVRILARHVLPNVMGPIIAIATILVARMIIAESALSFLGLGVRPPTASWGSMLNDSQSLLLGVPRLTLYPAVLISMAVFGFNLFGEGLRDAFDPKD